VSASFTVISPTTIQATVPPAATTGPISLTTAGGTATSASGFTVTPSPPTVTSFAPTNARVGTNIQISGTNFGGASKVTFNGVSASFTVISPTTIQATVPAAAATGAIGVTTPGGTAMSPNSFTVMVTLSVTKTSTLGVGHGTVASTSSPASANQIYCGPNCSVDFAYGTVVTLTATPAMLSLFDGWSGCDSASGTTCTLTLKSASTVTARFLP
jgi:IPT/TIG domain-containing protein/List-Bact-rpt repeat protein